MAKNPRSSKREAKRNRRLIHSQLSENMSHEDILDYNPSASKIEPKTINQSYYIQSIESNILTFGMGHAGTGKTYVATCLACDMYSNKEIQKIVITRPAVEVGKSLGALPGELSDKMEPYIAPVYDILVERFGKNKVEYLMKRGDIVCEPLNYLRGKSLYNSFVIFDEAQNATPEEVLMMLTRIGEHSKLVINGDLKQKDIKVQSGLADAFYKLKGMSSSGYVEFGIEDIVRSGFVKDVLIRYAA